MVIDFRSQNASPKLQKIFVEVINQEQWFYCFFLILFFFFFFLRLKREKLRFTNIERGSNKTSKALVWHLGSIKELANGGLRFRGFKAANTLRWMYLKVRNIK